MEGMGEDETPQREILEVHMMALSDQFQLTEDVVAALKTDTSRFVKTVKMLGSEKEASRRPSNGNGLVAQRTSSSSSKPFKQSLISSKRYFSCLILATQFLTHFFDANQ
jgi:hypothetical protein